MTVTPNPNTNPTNTAQVEAAGAPGDVEGGLRD